MAAFSALLLTLCSAELNSAWRQVFVEARLLQNTQVPSTYYHASGQVKSLCLIFSVSDSIADPVSFLHLSFSSCLVPCCPPSLCKASVALRVWFPSLKRVRLEHLMSRMRCVSRGEMSRLACYPGVPSLEPLSPDPGSRLSTN